MPRRIRFGLTRGSLIELSAPNNTKEYIGYCINLASRLQKHSGEAGFLASPRILPGEYRWFTRHEFTKVKPHGLPGIRNELVYIDKDDLVEVQKQNKSTKLARTGFEILPK